MLFADLADLREAAADWERDPKLFEIEREAYGDLWAYNVIGHDLRVVQRSYQAGELGEDEEKLYQQLMAEFEEVMPILEKLGFSLESLRL